MIKKAVLRIDSGTDEIVHNMISQMKIESGDIDIHPRVHGNSEYDFE